MEGRNKEKHNSAGLLFATLPGVLWLLLIILKALNMVSMGWIPVLLGIVWIPVLAVMIYAALVFLLTKAARFKRWYRRRKVDKRIIRQAKAAGVWNKRPTPLGGRALELKAWEDFRIKRLPGETDYQLRNRCMAAADEEYAKRRIDSCK